MWKTTFWGESDKEILEKVRGNNIDWREEEWKNISPEGQAFVKELLTVKPSNRPSPGEALQNKWFKKYLYKHPVQKEQVQDFYNNICTFKIDPLLFFQQATLAYMIHHLTKKKILLKLNIFIIGLIIMEMVKMEYKEVCEGFRQFININEKELTKIFKYIDQGHTGCIEYEEFCRACINKKELLVEENLKYFCFIH